MRESDDLFHLMDLFNTSPTIAGIPEKVPNRPLHRRNRPGLVPARRRRTLPVRGVYIWTEEDLMAMHMYEYKIHVKVVQPHAQWLDIGHDHGERRRPRQEVPAQGHRAGPVTAKPHPS